MNFRIRGIFLSLAMSGASLASASDVFDFSSELPGKLNEYTKIVSTTVEGRTISLAYKRVSGNSGFGYAHEAKGELKENDVFICNLETRFTVELTRADKPMIIDSSHKKEITFAYSPEVSFSQQALTPFRKKDDNIFIMKYLGSSDKFQCELFEIPNEFDRLMFVAKHPKHLSNAHEALEKLETKFNYVEGDDTPWY
jgi:hypothetical protein